MSEHQGDTGRQAVFSKVSSVISCQESLQYSFDRMESDSDQSDEDMIPEIAKMAKKKVHRDLMFHMEM